jgi:hypothetical protein
MAPTCVSVLSTQAGCITCSVAAQAHYHHDVKDTDHWLASSKREEFFGPLGVTNIRTFVDRQNPTHVAMIADVPDMEAFTAAMQTDASAEAMADDGVLPETLVILVEA